MFSRSDFSTHAPTVTQWIADYYKKLPELPVKSQVKPGEIYAQIEGKIPESGQPFGDIIADLDRIILPGITHWQHPNFHAFFPANGSIESLFAEMITAAIGAQCMVWETSPAAAELEQRMMEWLRDAMKLPTYWEGVIQDTASTATLTAIVCAREQSSGFSSNDYGVPNNLRVYCSTETHSSIEKAVGIAGMGRKNLVKISVDEQGAMIPALLEQAIKEDIANGKKPCCIITALGTTGTVAFDDNEAIGIIAKKYDCWLHVDAAYAGSAQLLPENQWMNKGLDYADSYVFNPHKWLFTNFDCTAYYVKDVSVLLKCMEILPEYLKTNTRGQVNDYRDWGIPLGRRFRALKLWFVLRHYGLNAIQEKLRTHIGYALEFSEFIKKQAGLTLVAGPTLNFVGFRCTEKAQGEDIAPLNERTKTLLEKINASGKAYLSHTKKDQYYIIRVIFGQTYLNDNDLANVCSLLKEKLEQLKQP
jgi:aromatic-L-amino-acid decarboxylase